MDGFQEGGVHTQKVSVTLGILALLMLGAFACCAIVSDDSDAATTVNVVAEKDFCGVNTSLSDEKAYKVKYTLSGDDTYYYTAVLKDSSDVSSGKVSPEKGSVTSTYSPTVTVTAPLLH